MIEEPKTMQELHEIQVQIHEETENLASGERAKKANEAAREFVKKHNLNLEFIEKH